MIEFNFSNIENMELSQLYQQLGMADFTYIETSEFLERLQEYRQSLHNQIKKSYDNNTDIHQAGSGESSGTR
jgi:hypothetical protein